MGPSNPSDPMSDALSQRSNQAYQSSLNSMMRQADMSGVDRKIGLQGQDLNNQAALFQNYQSRAALNYKEISRQRESIIVAAQMRRELLNSIFGAIGQASGGGAALYHSKNQHPTEMPPYDPSQNQSPVQGAQGTGQQVFGQTGYGGYTGGVDERGMTNG